VPPLRRPLYPHAPTMLRASSAILADGRPDCIGESRQDRGIIALRVAQSSCDLELDADPPRSPIANVEGAPSRELAAGNDRRLETASCEAITHGITQDDIEAANLDVLLVLSRLAVDGNHLIARADERHAMRFIKVGRGDMQISVGPVSQPLKAVETVVVTRDCLSDQRCFRFDPPTVRRDDCYRTFSPDDVDSVINVSALCTLKCLEARILVSH
jgi:hypothetical protein